MSAAAMVVVKGTPNSRVFISYTQKDYEFVQHLTSDLESAGAIEAGLTVFYDKRIKAGESWADSLVTAMESADYIIVVLSPDYLTSLWGKKELEVALLLHSQRRALIIPLLVRPCVPTGLISSLTFIDFTQSYDAGFTRLLASLGVLEGSLPPVRERYVIEGSTQELKALIDNLKDAVNSFRARPSEQIKQQLPSSESGRCCFIIMPFNDEELNVVYEDFVKPIVENECELKCERGDDVFGSNVVIEDILTSIKRADLMIADLTRKNANVFYEVGISHVLGKEVLLLAQSIDDVPFDLRHRRVLLYEYTPRGCKRLEKTLKESILAILQKLDSTDDVRT